MRGGYGIFASAYQAVASSPPVVASTSTRAKLFVPSGDTTTITKPTGVSTGDLLLVFVNYESLPNTITVTGFTQRIVSLSTGGGFDQETRLFERIADGTEGASFTINVPTTGTQISAIAARITGASASPHDVSNTTSSSGNYWLEHQFASLTTTTNNDLMIGFLGGGSALDNSTISGWTLNTNTTETYMYSKTVATAGSTGVTNFDQPTTFDLWASISVAYKPA
jgi:hypothetical protein